MMVYDCPLMETVYVELWVCFGWENPNFLF